MFKRTRIVSHNLDKETGSFTVTAEWENTILPFDKLPEEWGPSSLACFRTGITQTCPIGEIIQVVS